VPDASVFSALLEPRSVAFVGASTSPAKWGFNIFHNIVKGGFTGSLYPINAQGGTWFGRPLLRSLAEVPRPIDLAIVVVPKEAVPDTLRQCAWAGVRAAVVITAGFGETGAAGRALEQEVVAIARAGGLRLVGPNTMGVVSAWPSPLQAVMSGATFPPGHVAVVSQSGNLGSSIADRLIRRGLGISRLVSSGNEADLTIEDYLEYLETDAQTRVVCLYVEGLRQGRRFLEVARRTSARKPIILLKGGTGPVGARAALSHTGALTGSFEVFRSMCRQANVVLAETMDELVDVAGLLLTQPAIAGSRIGVVTQGGGFGVVAADQCEAAGLELPPLDDDVVARLDALLPPFWSRRNPVDLVAPGRVSMFGDAIEVLLRHAGMDAIVLLGLGYLTCRAVRWLESPVLPREAMAPLAEQMIAGERGLMELLARQIRELQKPIIPVVDIVGFDLAGEDNVARRLDAMGIMAYDSPERAVRALAQAAGYYRRRRELAAG
jgi:acyl-CoA synthetase (NDP forming)